jgi:hypothetical protein
LESLCRGRVVCTTRPWICRRPETPGHHHSSQRLHSSAGHDVEVPGPMPASPRTSRSATYLPCMASSCDGGRAYLRGASPCPVGGISVRRDVRQAVTRATMASMRLMQIRIVLDLSNHGGESPERSSPSIATRIRCSARRRWRLRWADNPGRLRFFCDGATVSIGVDNLNDERSAAEMQAGRSLFYPLGGPVGSCA